MMVSGKFHVAVWREGVRTFSHKISAAPAVTVVLVVLTDKTTSARRASATANSKVNTWNARVKRGDKKCHGRMLTAGESGGEPFLRLARLI